MFVTEEKEMFFIHEETPSSHTSQSHGFSIWQNLRVGIDWKRKSAPRYILPRSIEIKWRTSEYRKDRVISSLYYGNKAS